MQSRLLRHLLVIGRPNYPEREREETFLKRLSANGFERLTDDIRDVEFTAYRLELGQCGFLISAKQGV